MHAAAACDSLARMGVADSGGAWPLHTRAATWPPRDGAHGGDGTSASGPMDGALEQPPGARAVAESPPAPYAPPPYGM